MKDTMEKLTRVNSDGLPRKAGLLLRKCIKEAKVGPYEFRVENSTLVWRKPF